MQDSRNSIRGGGPVNRTRRTWNSNGVHFTVETSSFVSPGFSFSTTSSNANAAPRPRGGGLLGTAFGLIGDVLSAQQQRPTPQRNVRQDFVRQPYVTDTEDDELESEESEDAEPQSRPQTLFSQFADRARNPQRTQRGGESRERSPIRRPSMAKSNHRTRSYRTEERQPGRKSSKVDYSSYEDESDDSYVQPQRQRRSSRRQSELIEALENAADHHRREARKCRTRLDQASAQRTGDLIYLQKLTKELKDHEKSEQKARRTLQEAKVELERDDSPRTTSRRPRPSRTSTADAQFGGTFPFHNFDAFSTHRSATDPLFNDSNPGMSTNFGGFPFAAFDQLFRDFGLASGLHDDMHRQFFEAGLNSGQTRGARFASASTNQPFPPASIFTATPTAPPKPPSTLLAPAEAKKLYQAYNARWNALIHTDPNIPFPARKLGAAALNARNSLWAPNISSPVATWSEETVMQANVQAFFLGAAGLTPQYTEVPATGKVQMSYDKRKATAAQVEELIGILKKEKTRWHSDRLGRRNGGTSAGPNEQLQRDERARAVFHAVCELMEAAQ